MTPEGDSIAAGTHVVRVRFHVSELVDMEPAFVVR
jgi:hypothetical protein